MKCLAVLTAAVAVGVLAFAAGYDAHSNAAPAASPIVASETIYIRNEGQRYFPNRQIRRDILAWEEAANKYFAPVWHTPQVRIVLLRRKQEAPQGGIVATFQEKGPVYGALAYHTDNAGVPGIVVYSGTGVYYGFSNSESFTHEMFELLADQFISEFNIGYEYPFYYLGDKAYSMPTAAPWFNEVCDPVEKYGWKLHGVQISDFITPAWFNDSQGNEGFDYMGLVQHPFQVIRGGYAQFVINGQDNIVTDMRDAGPDAEGFLRGEKEYGAGS